MGRLQLSYFSRNRIAAPALADELRDILATAQQRNRENGITGVLVFNEGMFGQFIEGEAGRLEETFERIQRDTRHHDVTVLEVCAQEAPLFPDWSMGFVGTRRALERVWASIAPQAQTPFRLDRLDAAQMLEVLHRLALEHEVSARVDEVA